MEVRWTPSRASLIGTSSHTSAEVPAVVGSIHNIIYPYIPPFTALRCITSLIALRILV